MRALRSIQARLALLIGVAVTVLWVAAASVTSTILWATLFALTVHFVFALFEYEGIVPK